MKRIRVAKNQPKSWKISTKIIRKSYIFFKTIKPMFTDINIYPINIKTGHISEKYIFYRNKSKTKVDIFPILGRIWSRIRSVISRNGSEDPDPYQNETDPQH